MLCSQFYALSVELAKSAGFVIFPVYEKSIFPLIKDKFDAPFAG